MSLTGTFTLSHSIVPVLLHPKSQGHILLKSKSASDHPIIEPNYLTESVDVDTLADACLTAMKRCDSHRMTQHIACSRRPSPSLHPPVVACDITCSLRLHEPMKSIAGDLVRRMHLA